MFPSREYELLGRLAEAIHAATDCMQPRMQPGVAEIARSIFDECGHVAAALFLAKAVEQFGREAPTYKKRIAVDAIANLLED